MRYLILSDIHANIDALDAVLEAVSGGWEQVLVLGDLVGYGAEPNSVIDRVRELQPVAVIRGNHDKAACGLDDGGNFNQVARYAAAWTQEQLTPDNREYLRELPQGPTAIDDLVEICHGAPFDEDHYIFDAVDAQRALEASQRPVCIFGHTHLPVIFMASGQTLTADLPDAALATLTIQPHARYLINPGSVGQPRDGDPRAAFGLVDTERLTVSIHRIPYPVAKAQARIVEEGLPEILAERLAVGR